VVVPEEGVQRRAHDLPGAAHGRWSWSSSSSLTRAAALLRSCSWCLLWSF
jgi:hypothetical protein